MDDIILLRESAEEFPDNLDFQIRFAEHLFYSINNNQEINNFEKCNELITELLELSTKQPDIDLVQSHTAGALSNLILNANDENELDYNFLFGELRALAKRNNTQHVKSALANALYNLAYQAKEEKERQEHDALLEELRLFSPTCANNVEVTFFFSLALYNAVNYALEENDLKWRDALLKELRELENKQDKNYEVTANFARSLQNSTNHIQRQRKYNQGFSLLQELRKFAEQKPDNQDVQTSFAITLFNTFIYMDFDGFIEKRDEVANELMQLYQNHEELTFIPKEFFPKLKEKGLIK
ncbi:hypothetical protein [Sessilibacter corallicola]|uniref:hypothetical protein n=1 Tax=Sessilibacter corallicola TaxID=2904075 RepID=UPI001E338DF3|nr:hypothetical protein [Sessilibacter corallicola]MCE2030188.1 hypothetical protein [Sessilibacter corallicola]